MPTYMARTEWRKTEAGDGIRVSVGSGALSGQVDQRPRAGKTTNAQELIGAALAGDFTLTLAELLTEAGHPPAAIRAAAAVDLGKGDGRPHIRLDVEVDVDAVPIDDLRELIDQADDRCAVTQALAGADLDIHPHFAR